MMKKDYTLIFPKVCREKVLKWLQVKVKDNSKILDRKFLKKGSDTLKQIF